MASKLDNIIGALNKDPKLTTFNKTGDGEIKDWIPTLIPVFDHYMIGGIPASGRVSQIFGPPSSGKGHPASTKIPTPNGMKTIGDLKAGDYVFDHYGKPTKVLGVYPRGKMDLFRVMLQDNSSVIVSKDHIWSVVTSRNHLKNITTEELMKSEIHTTEKNPDRMHYRYHIPLAKWVMYHRQDYPINPYVLGAFLGDGCLSQRQLTISSNDPFVVNKISKLLPWNNTPRINSSKNYSWTFKLNETLRGRSNEKLAAIQTRQVFGALFKLPTLTRDKFIPDEYLYNDLETRLQVAQGLLDTDGSVHGNKGNAAQIMWTSVNKKLAHQFRSLLKSLGYNVYLTKQIRDRQKEGRGIETAFTLCIKGKRDELAKLITLPRHLDKLKVSKTNIRHFTDIAIKDIQPLHKQDDIICIYVDNPEHLYLVTEDYIVTHNTTFTSTIMKNAIKMGLVVVYFDVEGTQNNSRLEQLDVDTSKVLTYTPTHKNDGTMQELSIEEIGKTMIKILAQIHDMNPNQYVLFIWDSIAISESEMQVDTALGNQVVGQQAKALTTVGRKLQVNLLHNNGVLLAINQARDDFNAPNPKYATLKSVGGKGWEHLLSTNISLNQSGKIYKKSTDKEPIGTETRVKVVKSKVGDNWGSDFKMDIIGAYGYDFEYNLVESAQANGLISKGRSPKYESQSGETLKAMNIYHLVQDLKKPENQGIRDEIWQRLLLMYFPTCYPPLFNTNLFMHLKDFPMIKNLRTYYIKQQQALDPIKQDYNYKHFVQCYKDGKLPKDIADEVKDVIEGNN